MTQFVWIVILGLCVAALVVRLSDLRVKRDNHAVRWFSAGMALLVLSMVLQITAVHLAVDRHTALGFAGMVSNCLTVGALVSARCAFQHLLHPPGTARGRARSQLHLAGAVCAVIVLLFWTTGSNYAEFLAKSGTADAVPVMAAHSYVYVCYVIPVTIVITREALACARGVDRFTARISLRLLAVSGVLGTAYSVLRLAAMLADRFGLPAGPLNGQLIGVLFRTAIVTVVLAVVLPAVGRHLGIDRFARWLGLDHTYRALFPLWRALHEQFPDIALETPARHVPFDAPERALYRRVIEIWDGLLRLRPYLVGGTGAAEVAAALRALRRGEPPPGGGASIASTGDDVARLVELSKAYHAITAAE
ncbi:hypothetical protein ALI22I_37785 [Saccharothrix sp. ALI-22-I]|uniref:MAB_1171c family putative transporter n=1 Tax=Saccharothrix sp. ALI-22-I TaxID=1933778 RepID=UPI00097BB076|nr:MAB_1171c family putative transporter [Saccharothrix sp. ALI-22-I]ONI81939.1 hypothetical protein ALI22I_37785 [Saccharothrix sp. ALI-22-I]